MSERWYRASGSLCIFMGLYMLKLYAWLIIPVIALYIEAAWARKGDYEVEPKATEEQK